MFYGSGFNFKWYFDWKRGLMVLFTMSNIFWMGEVPSWLWTYGLFSMFRLKSYSDDDCGPGDAIPSFRRNFCLAYCNFMMWILVMISCNILMSLASSSYSLLMSLLIWFACILIGMLQLFATINLSYSKVGLCCQNEMYRYISLLVYVAVVNLPRLNLY